MAEEAKQDQVGTQDQGSNDAKMDLETLKADLKAELSSEFENKYKSEIAGLNRKNSELSNELTQKSKEVESEKQKGLSDLEKMQLELDQVKKSQMQAEKDALVARNTASAKDLLREAELSPDFVEFLNVEDIEKMNSGIDQLKGLADTMKKTFAQEFAKSNGQSAPKTGVLPLSDKKKQSDFDVKEASQYVKENGIEAWNALPK